MSPAATSTSTRCGDIRNSGSRHRGLENVSAGGVANGTTVSGGGELDILAGASANGTTVQGGTLKLFSGGIIHGVTVNSFGSLELIGGASIGDTSFQSNTNLQLGPGEMLSNFTVSNGLWRIQCLGR
jgi:autotransporter passenger strand-loop-strand repeat protein